MFQDEQPIAYSIPVFLGINQSKAEHLLQPGETTNCMNVNIDDGNLKTCNNYNKYITTPLNSGGITLMTYYKNLSDGSIKSYILAATRTNVFWWDSANTQWKVIKTGLLDGRIDYINYQKDIDDIIIMSNGMDTMFKWDGVLESAINLAGSPPLAKSITLHYERVWATNDSSHPNSVYYSDELNPENWTQSLNDGGIIEIPTWDGGKCIGITNIFDDVVVFKTYNLWKISGTYPGEYSKQQVFSTTGAIAERSIVNAVNETFFLAKDGIYVFNGTSAVKISDPIKNIIATMSKLYAENACAVFFNNKYIIAIPTGLSAPNNLVIEYDTINKNFIVKDIDNITSFSVLNNETLLFLKDEGIDSYVYNYYTNASFGREFYWETPYSDMQSINSKKTINYVYGYARGIGQLQITAYDENNNSNSTTIDLNSNTEPKHFKKRLRIKGRKIKFIFSMIPNEESIQELTLSNPTFLYDIDTD